MIVYKKGDVLKSGETLIVHGCNCKNTMAAGIARQVRTQCPNAYAADRATICGDIKKLGTFTYALEDNGMCIFNAYTQYNYNRNVLCLDYEALEKSISSICEWIRQYQQGESHLAMPKIGCGLAGGDWKIVSEILERVSDKYNMEFRVYEL